MADFNALEALINANIKKNGVQAITGNILNGILRGMVSALGKGYTIAGSVTPSSDPGTMTGPVAYIAYTAGTYTHFDGLEVEQGEVAMLIYNEAEWHKEVLYSLAATATVDGNVGTPEVGVSFVDGLLTFDSRNMKGEPGENGQDGEAAGFGAVTASVDASVGTPSVTVSSSGPNTAKSFAFSFHNLKGEQGVQGIQGIQGPQGVQGEQGIQGPVGVESCVVTVDNTTGTPSCSVSLVGQVLHLDFTGLKGAQGDTGSSVDYPFTIVNNLTTNDATQALSAAMGVQLESEVSQLEAKVDDISTGKYYGYFAKEEDLPEADVDGFAYVGEGPTYTIYNLRGGVWTSSDITVNQSPIGNDEDIDQNEDGKLQFANRVYNSQQPNGMGYKILRKDATFASQVTDTNTIYDIRYDFSLNNATITIPAGCVLHFNGGQISGGILSGNDTLLSGSLDSVFDNVVLSGNWKNQSASVTWWGCVPFSDEGNQVDNSDRLNCAFSSSILRVFVPTLYGVSSPLHINGYTKVIGVKGYPVRSGFMANDDFSGNSVTLSRDGNTYSVNGVFYHSYDEEPKLQDITIGCRKKCKYAIQHLAGASHFILDNVAIYDATIAGILQYACEKPRWEHLYIDGCNAGIFISKRAINESDILDINSGASKGNANMVTMRDVRVLHGNYGIIINAGTPASLIDCETSRNAFAGLVLFSATDIWNYYSELDAIGNFYLDSELDKHTSPSGDGYVPNELITQNKDGILLDSALYYNANIYVRAVIWAYSNCNIHGAFISGKPRSFSTSDVSAAGRKAPTERTASGIDAIIYAYGYAANVVAEGVSFYAHNNNTGVAPYYFIIVNMQNTTSAYPQRIYHDIRRNDFVQRVYCAKMSAAYGGANLIAKVGEKDFYRSQIDFSSPGVQKEYNNPAWLGLPWGGLTNNRYQFTSHKLSSIYDGCPLVERDTTRTSYDQKNMLKETLQEIVGTRQNIKLRVIVKVKNTITSNIRLYVVFSDITLATTVKQYTNNISGSQSYSPGLYEYRFIVPTDVFSDAWETFRVFLSVANESNGDVEITDVMMYDVDAPITPPSYTSYELESGTTTERPNKGRTGQTFFDTTLGKMVVSNGTAWVNMDGTAL